MSDRLTGRPGPEDTSGDPPGSGASAPARPAVDDGGAGQADSGLLGGPDGRSGEPGGRSGEPGGRSGEPLGRSGEPVDEEVPDKTAVDEAAPETALDEAAGDKAAGDPAPARAAGNKPAPARAAGNKAARPGRSLWVELPVLIVIALAIALLIKTFVVQAFYIPSASMENTLEIGDKILVNKVVYDFRSIQPGDIVVFDGTGSWDAVPPPAKPSSDPIVRAYHATVGRLLSSIAGLSGTAPGQTDFIKRVIGVPGDKVACCNAQGLVTVNGVPLHEQSYIFPGETPGEAPPGYSGRFSITVPPGRLWVMGDNRAVSDDSRLRQSDPGHGTIPENEVIGRAWVIVWPPSRWRVLPIPSTFLQPKISASASASASAAVSGTVRAVPAAPYLPLAGGFAAAVPLTWLQRTLRRRTSHRRQRRRRPRSHRS